MGRDKSSLTNESNSNWTRMARLGDIACRASIGLAERLRAPLCYNILGIFQSFQYNYSSNRTIIIPPICTGLCIRMYISGGSEAMHIFHPGNYSRKVEERGREGRKEEGEGSRSLDDTETQIKLLAVPSAHRLASIARNNKINTCYRSTRGTKHRIRPPI